LFSEFDTDGSEHIDSDELAAMLTELDAQIADGRLDMSSADIGSLVEKIDTNNDGLISREELRQYLVHMGLDKKQRPRAASRAAEVALLQEATGIQSSTAAQKNSDDAVSKWLETA
jgi:Ca2+-binding EF-hand superfamily protein